MGIVVQACAGLCRPVMSDILYACTVHVRKVKNQNKLFSVCVYEISLKMANQAQTCWKQ
jgi:hypothetical protein